MKLDLILKFMKWFANIECNFIRSSCNTIFGNESPHIWYVWEKSNKSLITFYSNIGKSHQEKMIKWSVKYMDPELIKFFQ